MQPMWGVRTAHPPLLIPWNEINVEQASGWMAGSLMKLSLGGSEQVPFTIRRSLGARLRAAAGASWPASAQAEIKIG